MNNVTGNLAAQQQQQHRRQRDPFGHNLPPEIRLMIYRRLFKDIGIPDIDPCDSPSSMMCPPALAQVNEAFRSQLLPFWAERVVFRANINAADLTSGSIRYKNYKRWMRLFGRTVVPYIRRFRICNARRCCHVDVRGALSPDGRAVAPVGGGWSPEGLSGASSYSWEPNLDKWIIDILRRPLPRPCLRAKDLVRIITLAAMF